VLRQAHSENISKQSRSQLFDATLPIPHGTSLNQPLGEPGPQDQGRRHQDYCRRKSGPFLRFGAGLLLSPFEYHHRKQNPKAVGPNQVLDPRGR
jgi:hypothetical protein